MKCPRCNYENHNGKFCEKCGCPLPVQVEGKRRKAWYKRWWIWVLMALGTIILLFNATCTCALLLPDSLKSTPDSVQEITVSKTEAPTEKPTEKQTEKPTEKPTEKQTEKPTEAKMTAEDIIQQIVDKGFEEVSPSVLYNHYEDYNGKKIVTAILVTNTAYNTLYSEIDKDAFLSDLYFSFDKGSDTNGAKEGDYVIVFGVGNGKATFGDHPMFKNCYVAAKGEQAKIEYDKLAREANKAEKEKQSQAEEKAKKDKEDYISSCTTIDYATLARNPDKFKGNHYKFTGKVIQVMDSDSWFSDATTLRVNVTRNESEYLQDYWDDTVLCTVTIPQGADRILEDDIITFYGDCDGLYTYTAILGQKISLPKIDIKYYDIS